MKGKETRSVFVFKGSHLKKGEKIVGYLEGWIGDMMGSGENKQHNGMFILTDQRACFFRKGWFGEVLETMPLAKIASIEAHSSMGHRILRLHTSHDALEFKTFEQKDLFDRILGQIEELRGSDGEEHPTAKADHSDSPASLLAQLASLRDAGAITDEEFENKKADLLRRM